MPHTNRHGYRRVPDSIRAQIESLAGQPFHVGRRWRVATDELPTDLLADLGIQFVNGDFRLPESGIPAATARWSRWNQRGRIIIRRDLPKVPRSWDITTPNFGDGARYGYSTHTRTIEAYPRTRMHGKGFTFAWDSQTVGTEAILTVRVEIPFSGSDSAESPDLLMALSLIGEAFGAPAIIRSEETPEEWLASQTVAWEFLPVGEGEPLPSFEEIARRVKLPDGSPDRHTYRERYDTVTSLQPRGVLTGTTGLLRYVAFDFGESKVLENFSYGNAVYVMRGDWESLSKLSRPELRSLSDADFDRIVHRKGWQSRLAKALGR